LITLMQEHFRKSKSFGASHFKHVPTSKKCTVH
jgi:hypothetical protein